MNRTFTILVVLVLVFSFVAYADGDQPSHKKLTLWSEYLVGSGGTVGNLWSFGSGGQYAFLRDDYNHELSVSIDHFNDRTAYSGNKVLLPVLFNYRWYTGTRIDSGLYVSGGVGLAIPFGLDHGTGSFAWQLSSGYVFSDHFSLALRYIGRRSQTVLDGAGNAFTTNSAFSGGMLDFTF